MTRSRGALLDEMLSGAIAAQLRGRGHDVVAVVEGLSLVGLSDGDLLVYAASQRRRMVTANVRDFAALHAAWVGQGRAHAGLIDLVTRVFPQDRSFPGAVVTALDDLLGGASMPLAGHEHYLRPRS